MKLIIFLLFLFLPRILIAQIEVQLLKTDSFAINQALRSSENCKKSGDKKEESRDYDQLGLIYWEHNYYTKAIEYYQKSLELNQQLDNMSGVSMLNTNLGLIYADCRNFEKAYSYFQKTLAYRKMMKEKVGVISTQINISVVLNNLKRYNESIRYLNEALSLAQEMNDMEQMRSCYGQISETYVKAHKSDSANYYFELYRTFHEKIQGDKSIISQKEVADVTLKIQITEIENKNKELQLKLANSELEQQENQLLDADAVKKKLYSHLTKTELQNELLKRENIIKGITLNREKSEVEKQKNKVFFLAVVFILSVIILIGLFVVYFRNKRKNQQISEQKRLIEEQQKKFTDSVNYAKYIQEAMLRRNIKLEDHLKDNFILFKPLAVVSGDFYWFTNIGHFTIIVVADCTGHGVPGALMSMIGINLLNQIVEVNQTVMPHKILEELNNGIFYSLNQHDNTNRDGMDVSICAIDKHENMFHFAGAMRPMILITDGNLSVIKGDKKTIGGGNFRRDSERKYQTISFPIKPNDTQVYLFSDGITDQFSAQNKKKFSSKRLQEIIYGMYQKPCEEQKMILEVSLQNWQGAEPQLDDILVIGIQL